MFLVDRRVPFYIASLRVYFDKLEDLGIHIPSASSITSAFSSFTDDGRPILHRGAAPTQGEVHSLDKSLLQLNYDQSIVDKLLESLSKADERDMCYDMIQHTSFLFFLMRTILQDLPVLPIEDEKDKRGLQILFRLLINVIFS